MQRKLEALQRQVENYAAAVKDSEIWSAQREGVIKQQGDQLAEAKAEVEGLRRELEAVELMKFGSPKAVDRELKQLKEFYALSERLVGATHHITRAGRDLERVEIRRKQALELMNILEDMERAVNTFRVELHNHCQPLGINQKGGGHE